MKRILSAIAAALRSSVSFVWDKCTKTGSWTLRAVASIVGGGASAASIQSPLQDFESELARDAEIKRLLEPVPSALPPKTGGDGYDRIQRACLALMNDRAPDPEDLSSLSPAQREWLAILDPQMRLIVGNVPKAALVEHMKGGKGLKGVVRSDAEAIKGWKRAIEIKRTITEIGEPEQEAKLAI